MKKEMYEKAFNLVKNRRIVIDNEGEKAVYFTARGGTGTYSVIIKPNGMHSCTCMQATIHANKEALCSHICAAIALLVSMAKK